MKDETPVPENNLTPLQEFVALSEDLATKIREETVAPEEVIEIEGWLKEISTKLNLEELGSIKTHFDQKILVTLHSLFKGIQNGNSN